MLRLPQLLLLLIRVYSPLLSISSCEIVCTLLAIESDRRVDDSLVVLTRPEQRERSNLTGIVCYLHVRAS